MRDTWDEPWLRALTMGPAPRPPWGSERLRALREHERAIVWVRVRPILASHHTRSGAATQESQ